MAHRCRVGRIGGGGGIQGIYKGNIGIMEKNMEGNIQGLRSFWVWDLRLGLAVISGTFGNSYLERPMESARL